ncbi:MAG: glycosyltransferase [Halioglobus sp.]
MGPGKVCRWASQRGLCDHALAQLIVNICHVVPTFDPAHGGPLIVATRLAEAQASLGHSVTLAGACEKEQLIQNQRAATHPNVEVRAFSGTREFECLMPFDLVELHGIWEPTLLKISRLCRRRSVPYVVCPHGMLDHWSLNQKALKKRVALSIFYKRMISRAGAIHALNKHEAQVISEKGLSQRVEVIPNGVSIDTRSSEGKIESIFPELADKTYVLFLGRLHYKKGLDILAEAWKQVITEIPAATLVVAGPDEDGSINDFRARILRAGIKDSVVELGAVYDHKKWILLRGCRCFVLPSRQEGFSVATLEALACSKPVVITRECHFDEVLEADAGFVCDLDATELASAMMALLGNDALGKEMGRRGQQMVCQHYQWPDVARRSLDVYSSVLSESA